MSIFRYVAAMAKSILAGTCLLDEQSTTEHRLLVEFYWMLHKMPEYLVQTNCMECREGLDHMGERQAGLQELWDIIAKTNPAGVQTLQRRMMLQLGALERGGCIRLDQVWSAQTNEKMAEVYLVANQMMLDVLEGPSEKFQERAQAIQAELHAVLQDLAKRGRSRARRERSPSVKMVESNVKATGKTVAESRQTKRAREEKGAQKAARRTLTPPKPDYKLKPSRRRGPTATTTRSGARTRRTPGASAAIGPGPSRSVRPCTCASRPWSKSAARSVASRQCSRSTSPSRRRRPRERGTSSCSTA
jgi:hypothetical protein